MRVVARLAPPLLLALALTVAPVSAVWAEPCLDLLQNPCPVFTEEPVPTEEPSPPPEEPPVEEPPVETPVQTPTENFESDLTDPEPAVPAPVVIVTPTPSPTRTTEPAPAGWNAPLYGGTAGTEDNTTATLALASSLALLLLVGIAAAVQVFVVRARRRRPPVGAGLRMLSDDEARTALLPAASPDFTEFDRQMLGYDRSSRTEL